MAQTLTFVLSVPVCGPTTLEDELEGELHLPAPLLAYVAPELVRVVYVAVRGRTIHAVQHVVSGEPKLNIERFANCRNWEVLEKRSVPVKLLPAAENIAAQGANIGEVTPIAEIGKYSRVTSKNSRG